MSRALLLTLRFHDGRYHGSGDWPPAPARLFQALVSAAAQGKNIPKEERNALLWLECLLPPKIVIPRGWYKGRSYTNFVPNNDLDVIDGDINRIGEIRTA